jgi:hypothetical protein
VPTRPGWSQGSCGRCAAHDVETVAEAGISGSDDAAVLAYATRTRRILLTRNGRDFVISHQADNRHAGLLIEHQDFDPSKNMTYAQITSAIDKLSASGWDLQGEVVSINAWV